MTVRPLRSDPWRGLLAVALGGLGVAMLGCSEGAEAVLTPSRATLAAELRLLDATGRSRVDFGRGEPIMLELRVTNLTSDTQTTRYPTSQTYEFAVKGPSDERVWSWSSGKSFAQVVTELHFAPHETREFTEVWEQTDDAGKLVAPGDYTAWGASTVEGAVRFRIE